MYNQVFVSHAYTIQNYHIYCTIIPLFILYMLLYIYTGMSIAAHHFEYVFECAKLHLNCPWPGCDWPQFSSWLWHDSPPAKPRISGFRAGHCNDNISYIYILLSIFINIHSWYLLISFSEFSEMWLRIRLWTLDISGGFFLHFISISWLFCCNV